MIELVQFWYLFPISILIATVAMSSGIGGAVFFSPIFILVLKLDPTIAIGVALITEFFGFSSGIYAYFKRNLIDFKLGRNLLIFSIPAAILGVLYADAIPDVILKAIFAVGLLFIGVQLFSSLKEDEKDKSDEEISEEFAEEYESCVIDSVGTEYKYTVCNKWMGRIFAFMGGGFVGMISVGLAELQDYHLIARCKVPSPVAVATSIFVVVITVMVASVGHIMHFAEAADPEMMNLVLSLILFTVPGVIIGGQLGPWLQTKLDEDMTKRGVSVLFIITSIIMFSTLI